jgi:hypothetical protein
MSLFHSRFRKHGPSIPKSKRILYQLVEKIGHFQNIKQIMMYFQSPKIDKQMSQMTTKVKKKKQENF